MQSIISGKVEFLCLCACTSYVVNVDSVNELNPRACKTFSDFFSSAFLLLIRAFTFYYIIYVFSIPHILLINVYTNRAIYPIQYNII